MEDKVRKAFGEWSVHYEDTVGQEVERYSGMKYDEFRQRLMKAIDAREGDSALDVGTGTGLIAIEVAKRTGEKVVAIDLTPEMLEVAKSNIQKARLSGEIELKRCPAEKLPFADASFDLVTSALAIHHMQVPKVLSEMVRVLKKGGRLVIADLGASPSWRTPVGQICAQVMVFLYRCINPFSAKRHAEAAAFKNAYTPKEWERLLRKTSLRAFEVYSYPHPQKKWYPLIFIVTGAK